MLQIKNALPPPEICDECGSSNIELTRNSKLYGKDYGIWPKIYFCNDCKASVGCHPGTETPLGRMANRKIRRLRVKAHKTFDKVWKSGAMSRSDAYNWLARVLGISEDECHISWLTEDQLKLTIEFSHEYFEINLEALKKRKVKQDDKQHKREIKKRRQVKKHIKLRKSKRKF